MRKREEKVSDVVKQAESRWLKYTMAFLQAITTKILHHILKSII